MFQTNKHGPRVWAIKLGHLLSASKLGIVASSLFAIFIVYFLRYQVENFILNTWLLAVLSLTFFRLTWVFSLENTITNLRDSEVKRNLFKFRLGTFFSGLLWGVSAFFLLKINSLEHMMILMLVLAGLSAGGVVSYSIDFKSATLYTAAILIPGAISLLMSGLAFSNIMCFATIVYLLFLMVALRHVNTQSINNILLRIDSEMKDSFIKAGEERYYFLLEHLPMGVFHFDQDKVVTFCNQQLSQLLNDSTSFTKGANLNALRNKELLASVNVVINNATISRYEDFYEADSSNQEQWVSVLVAPNKNNLGEVVGGIGIVQDITERKLSARLIEQFALQDYLTELPNRRMMMNSLQRAVDDNATTGADIALIYIDIDNFKILNDTLGHAVGDQLLKQVANKLLTSLPQEGTIARAARIGGDEFVILLENLSNDAEEAVDQVRKVSNKIFARLNKPIKLSKHEYQCELSMGIALYNMHKGGVDDILRYADIAMYEAKKTGNAVCFYDASMLAVISSREDLKVALSQAIQQHEFELYYQVQVNAGQEPIGAEALIRWNRVGHGFVAPLDFIPLAEETGLIIPIGLWVVDHACQQLSLWEKGHTTRQLSIAINVSIQQLMEPSFATEVGRRINQYKIDPTRLKVEVTESMFLDNASEVIKTMDALKKLGIGIELDDFGTGYSCLQYLKQLPIKQLKIDQSFVRDIVKDKSDQSIVKTIIAMSQGFNIDVIAEGVETRAQFSLLKRDGCQHFQGYYFGKPMPMDAFEAALDINNLDKVHLNVKKPRVA